MTLKSIKQARVLSVSFSAALISATSVSAQSNTSLFKISDSQKHTFADFGPSVAVRDTYLGSDTTETLFLPYVNATYKGRYFILPALGAGVHLISNDKIRLSGSVNYALGRDGEDTPFDNEVFDVEDSIALNAAARISLPFAALDIVGALPVSGGIEGSKVDVLLTTQVEPLSNLKINPGVRLTYASSDWLNSYYGVSDSQSTLTGLTTSSLESEVSSYGAHVVAYWTVTDNYEIIGSAIYSKLTGESKDSVLSPKSDGVTFALGFARKF